MKRIKKTDLIIISVVLMIIIGFVVNNMLSNSSEKNSSAASKTTEYTDFNGKRLGIKTASAFEQLSFDYFPDSDYYYYDTTSDLMAALLNNKIDAFLNDEPVAKALRSENNSVNYLKKNIVDDDYCFGFTKKNSSSEIYIKQFNDMLAELKATGELEKIDHKWTKGDESEKTLDTSGLTGENGNINVAVMTDSVPFTYISNNELTGYAIELVTLFARKYGYSITYESGNATACLAGISTGKYDIFATNLSVTEERKQTMNFSDPFYNGGITVVARAEDIVENKITDPLEMNDKSYTLGTATGSSGMIAAETYLPNANLLMYDDNISAYEAVKLGKIDAYVYDRNQMESAIENGLTGVRLLEKDLGDPVAVAVGISRKTNIPDLEAKLNGFLEQLKADGSLDEIKNRWTVDKNYEMPDIPEPGSPDMKIIVGTTGIVEPYSFYKGTELTGFDIELSRRFAAYMNAEIEYKIYNFAGIITAASSNEIDCIFSNLNVTDERKEKIDFSEPIYVMHNTLMLQDKTNEKSSSWISSLRDSFRKNFIREDRYKLIIRGTKTTCYITIMSVLFGSILAFLICLFRRTDSILADGICDLYVKLIQGTPMVVLLMILYYIVFEKSKIDAEWVAIIGFSMHFSAYSSEIMQSGIESVDKGQREAALALGYSENQAFFRFIFPQAAVRSLPVYRGEVISLLKNTSIVGYIAVQDLNKMSDIIRSRTYEAFFPLIATAVIYFILAWIISILLNLLLKQIDPRSRKRTIKGAVKK